LGELRLEKIITTKEMQSKFIKSVISI